VKFWCFHSHSGGPTLVLANEVDVRLFDNESDNKRQKSSWKKCQMTG